MNRAERERLAYDSGTLQRASYSQAFPGSRRAVDYLNTVIHQYMQHCNGKEILEIGSTAWIGYIFKKNIFPKKLTCINISEAELRGGVQFIKEHSPQFPVEFVLMDAHALKFPDQHFDFVFGGAILHHLDLKRAIPEISRVTKKGGRVLFHEPFEMNPVAKIIRWATPKARTADERPLSVKDIRFISEHFNVNLHPSELTCVLPNIVSQLIFKRQFQSVDTLFFMLDKALSKLPLLPYLYRETLIYGERSV
jgi:ubiquinone/menaquinone biosynthesis C-methylase UbiE